MANPIQLEILRKGLTEWHEWRAKHPAVYPDLLGADLPGMMLDGINLENANLLRANLEGASLAEARLRNANLKEANLRQACLAKADLREANLYGARLEEAEMSRVDLEHASLIKAEFKRTRFDFARFGQTSFDHHLILGGLGLELIFHTGNSIIDVQIFEEANKAARGKRELKESIEKFFQNAGITERIVRAALEALAQVRTWNSCFISHSHLDKQFADRLSGELSRLGIPWVRDEDGPSTGARMTQRIAGSIINKDRTLLCCSWAALTNSWIEQEVEIALEKEEKEGKLVLIPLDIDGCLLENPHRSDGPDLGRRLRERVVGDFRDWRDPTSFDSSLMRLTEALRVGVGLSD